MGDHSCRHCGLSQSTDTAETFKALFPEAWSQMEDMLRDVLEIAYDRLPEHLLDVMMMVFFMPEIDAADGRLWISHMMPPTDALVWDPNEKAFVEDDT